MKDREILQMAHDILALYQQRTAVPSESVARVVVAIEREIQHSTNCPVCGRQRREV